MYFLIYEYGSRLAVPVKGGFAEGESASVSFTVTGTKTE
jgi:hypothetical protein